MASNDSNIANNSHEHDDNIDEFLSDFYQKSDENIDVKPDVDVMTKTNDSNNDLIVISDEEQVENDDIKLATMTALYTKYASSESSESSHTLDIDMDSKTISSLASNTMSSTSTTNLASGSLNSVGDVS